MPVLHFWCFQEANRSSLEENVLIRMAGDKDSYVHLNLSEKVETRGILGGRRGVDRQKCGRRAQTRTPVMDWRGSSECVRRAQTNDLAQGEAQADKKHDGGLDKAVLAYSADHYEYWRRELPVLEMSRGAFGENFTVAGSCEENVCIGDTYRVGKVLVQVSQPRVPCWKLGRRWNLPDLTKRVETTGRGVPPPTEPTRKSPERS